MTPTKKPTAKSHAAPAKKPAHAPAKKAAPKEKEHVAAEPAVAAAAAPVKVAGGYIYALGRRKRAIAQTKLWTTGKGAITVNDRPYTQYFPVAELRDALVAPLKAVGQDDKVTIALSVRGGGLRGQSEAARLGISRALLILNPTYRQSLKQLGFLTRDPREKERKKYGFKKARKGSQWAKR